MTADQELKTALACANAMIDRGELDKIELATAIYELIRSKTDPAELTAALDRATGALERRRALRKRPQ